MDIVNAKIKEVEIISQNGADDLKVQEKHYKVSEEKSGQVVDSIQIENGTIRIFMRNTKEGGDFGKIRVLEYHGFAYKATYNQFRKIEKGDNESV
jgi:hypothetical protein